MAIDSAQKRKSVAGIPFFIFGPGVTNDGTPGIEWRQETGWGYSGIAAAEPTSTGKPATIFRPRRAVSFFGTRDGRRSIFISHHPS